MDAGQGESRLRDCHCQQCRVASPELKRKGSFDEIFCISLPIEAERAKIFEVHLNKKKRTVTSLKFSQDNYTHLAKISEGFNCADIVSVVNDTFGRCFINDTPVTVKELETTVQETVSISKSCAKQIDAMKKTFSRAASRTPRRARFLQRDRVG